MKLLNKAVGSVKQSEFQGLTVNAEEVGDKDFLDGTKVVRQCRIFGNSLKCSKRRRVGIPAQERCKEYTGKNG